MNDPAASLSVVALFRHADIVVKSDLLILLVASVWSWTVIIEKLWRIFLLGRSVARHEALAAAARSAEDLLPQARSRREDPAGLVLSAGIAESAAEGGPEAETTEGRRERIERAMRLALHGQLRRLELRLPFLATLASAAPFIGLFGTVWGIMRSFAGIAAAHNTSLAVVAPGIAEALFATAMGLLAAIPAVVAYNKITVDLGRFSGRMQGVIGRAGRLLSRAAAGG
ncbi:MAG TPA: MotA/TolQ/ExbB proton channel family protein [Stellaceae bacterium]|nr:MotA/TolQ/ExbB proton channel family protein [Stellaceae bacterium]